MFFCEECRIKNRWPRSLGWPFMGISFGRCEVCKKSDVECHDVPSSVLTPEDQKSNVQKTIEKTIQYEFKRKAEDLGVYRLSGIMDIEKTKVLREIVIRRNGEVDWKATYELRLIAQKGYRLDEEEKRNRR